MSEPSTVDLIVAECRDYYAIPGNEAGGNLHLMLDDGNMEDENLMFCLKQCAEAQDSVGVMLVAVIATLDEDERADLYHHYREYAGGVNGRAIVVPRGRF